MKNKTRISYWFRNPGEEDPSFEVLTTDSPKVPEKGEVITLNTLYDKEWASMTFEDSKKNMLPSEESCIRGKFVVASVKRYIDRNIFQGNLVLETAETGSKGRSISTTFDCPVQSVVETFEVIIEPFRHTELTETPIAKLRNALGPVFACVQALQLMNEFPEKEKELLDLFKKSLKGEINESLEKSRELLRNDTNW